MKLIFAASLLFVGIVSQCQDVTVKMKDSTSQKIKVIVSSSKELRTSTDEHINFSDIAEVEFINYSEKRDYSLVKKMKASGVVIKNDPTLIKEPVKRVQNQDPLYSRDVTSPFHNYDTITVKHIVIKLESFRKQRQTGIAMELVGAALVTGGFILKNQNVNTKPENYNPIIIGGTVIGVVGFVVNFDAGRHLRFSTH